LIIDDDIDVLLSARLVLSPLFARVKTENDPYKIRQILEKEKFDVILMDMNYSAGETDGRTGLSHLKKITAISPSSSVVLMTAFANVQLAVEAMKFGANDFIIKPWNNEQLREIIRRILEPRLHKVDTFRDTEGPVGFEGMIGNSPAIQEIFRTIRKVSGTDANILITGENGTGKELVARALHKLSPRENQPFVTVDMGAVPESLFESELFGHKKGAFTDAREDRTGKFQMADGGTLFLDEIGNLSLTLQSRLLSALQTRSITPVGSDIPVPIHVRLVCATNNSLGKMVEEKSFRQDLLYRINTIEIRLPALRERKEDIPVIAAYYTEQYSRKYRSEPVTISPAAMQKLLQHPWPGNIRELQHSIERAVILCDGFEIRPADFIFQEAELPTVLPSHINLEEMEKQAIYNAIKKHEGNLTQAAKELGLGRTTLYRKMEKYGL